MEAIICQTCNEVIAYVESEKVGTLYGKCTDHNCKQHKEEQ